MFRAKEYVKAESLEDAYALNQKRSSVIVGGMMWLKMASFYKMTVIDLSALGLNYIEEDDQEFRIGCMCSLRQLELHEGLNQYFHGVFRECTRHIVGTQFRNTATVGGSVFGRFGFSDILTCLMMLDASVELYQGGIVSIQEFTEMKRGRDILVRVIIKKDGRVSAYTSQRQSKTDFPVIACGVAKKGNTYYISVGARPHKARLAVVREEDGRELQEMALLAANQMEFQSNMRASGDYRRHLANVYIRRLMEQLKEEEV
ncbi:MAG: FAD binding domain-containing protein [Lachnospiraceae bacterium]